FAQAFDSWFQRELAAPREGVRRALRRRPRGRDRTNPRQALLEAAWALSEHRDFDAPWAQPSFDRSAELSRVVDRLADVASFAARAEADLAARLRDELRQPLDVYERLKARSGKLDFLDLLLRARDLVREARPVREELQHRFTHLLVDEFQDTDPLQAELL